MKIWNDAGAVIVERGASVGFADWQKVRCSGEKGLKWEGLGLPLTAR